MTVISYPIPPYANVPIEADFYKPSRFVISAITRGLTTTVTTTVDNNYVVGQLVRLIIPPSFGTRQLNEQQGYVLSIPASTQVVLDIDSRFMDAFIANPYTSTITNATQAVQSVLTANNSFKAGTLLTISQVQGMTELNGANRLIISRTPTTITLDLDSTTFGAYTSGGLAVLQQPVFGYPQILAIGGINSGATNLNGRSPTGTFVPGAFINISPQ